MSDIAPDALHSLGSRPADPASVGFTSPFTRPRAIGAARRGFGAWAFAQRSWLPVPFAIALVVVTYAEWQSPGAVILGVLLVVAGQAVRLWAVRHIGGISRTRTTRLGPLITTGPYAWVRNPLYVGNLLLWTGFVFWSRLVWMLPVAWWLFVVQYRAIASWEQQLLSERYPKQYAAYARTVASWVPSRPLAVRAIEHHAWRDVLFSERGTLIAVIAVALLLAGKDLLH